MQKDLDSSHPELDIELIGLNPVGQEGGNALAIEGRDIPWLRMWMQIEMGSPTFG